jgi:hypothetical protein
VVGANATHFEDREMGAVNVFCVVSVSRWYRSDVAPGAKSKFLCSLEVAKKCLVGDSYGDAGPKKKRFDSSTDGGGEKKAGEAEERKRVQFRFRFRLHFTLYRTKKVDAS